MNLVSVVVLTVIILVCILFGYILGYAAKQGPRGLEGKPGKDGVDANGQIQ